MIGFLIALALFGGFMSLLFSTRQEVHQRLSEWPTEERMAVEELVDEGHHIVDAMKYVRQAADELKEAA